MPWAAECIIAQRCRGESGSHVQVAGASLAGNDHSLRSSTLSGRVTGLFGCGRATGSSLCGSVVDRSSIRASPLGRTWWARRMPAPSHHARANSARAVGRDGAAKRRSGGRDTMVTPSVERDALTMPSPRRLVLGCAVLAFLTGAGVAFLLPGGGADGAAWALLVLALACVTAFTATSQPTRTTSRPSRIRSGRVRASHGRRA